MTATDPESTPRDDQPDATNHGISTPAPAEGADDVAPPTESSPQG